MGAPTRLDPFPHLHVRPERGWVNDPNGIGYWGGRWHVMYQWNPASHEHADIHWGHMSSPDMLVWRDDGVALRPRSGGIDAAGVWSGVASVEADGVALVYTAVPHDAGDACVAVAREGSGGGWTQPDRSATRHPDHQQWVHVRDPFLVTVGDRRWGIMGAGRPGLESDTADGSPQQRRGAVLVYDATDLDHWTLLGPLLAADELPAHMAGTGTIWECPQLVQVGGRWVLVVSWDLGPASSAEGPDGEQGRRMGVTAYVGELDVTGPVPRFAALTETLLDDGPDFYAPQIVADGDRLLAWGWSWEGRGVGINHRPDAEIVASGWAGTLTLPREVVIDASGRAIGVPARELGGLVGERLSVRPARGGWEAHVAVPAWTASALGEVVIDLIDVLTDRVRPVWRAHVTDEPLRVFVDGSIVESFTGHGSTTLRAYPAAGEVWRVRSTGPMEAAVLRQPGR